MIVSPGLTKISMISTLSKSPISGTDISVVIVYCFNYNIISSFFSHVNIDSTVMSLILENISKFRFKDLGSKTNLKKIFIKKNLRIAF